MHQVEIKEREIYVDGVLTYVLSHNPSFKNPFPAWTVINLKNREIFSHDYRHEIVEIIARDEIDFHQWEHNFRSWFDNRENRIETIKYIRVSSATDPKRHYLLKLAATLGVGISWHKLAISWPEDGSYPYFSLVEAVNLYDKYYNHIHICE